MIRVAQVIFALPMLHTSYCTPQVLVMRFMECARLGLTPTRRCATCRADGPCGARVGHL